MHTTLFLEDCYFINDHGRERYRDNHCVVHLGRFFGMLEMNFVREPSYETCYGYRQGGGGCYWDGWG